MTARFPDNPDTSPPDAARLLLAWAGVGAVLLGCASALAAFSGYFDYAIFLKDKPSLMLAAGLAGAGLAFSLLLPLLHWTDRAGMGGDWRLIALIVAVGFALRLALLGSTPALEDDWYRYLWDGAVTAHGVNPYAVSPDEAQGEAFAGSLQLLAHESGVVIERINHSQLKTIYPPVAQAGFALAYWMQPWSLESWRAVCLVAEVVTLVLIFALLGTVLRPAAWAAVYWWNPVVVKELVNSAHMDALLMPFVLGGLLLAVRGWRVSACGLLALAAGVKIWPVILMPLVLRPLWSDRAAVLRVTALVVVVLGLIAWPVLAGGLDETSGFRAYAQRWQTNNAVFPVVADLLRGLLTSWGVPVSTSALAARGLFATALAIVIALVVRTPLSGPQDEVRRAALIVTALLLLSPAQFPWYLVWVLPLACVHPWRGFFAATVLLPIYYAGFHYLSIDDYRTFARVIVWLVWLPIFAAFLLDVREARRPREADHA